MVKVVVDPAQWLHGGKLSKVIRDLDRDKISGEFPVSVLRSAHPALRGQQCCLGFALRQIAGVKVSALVECDTPEAVKLTAAQVKKLVEVGLLREDAGGYGYLNTEAVYQLTDANDDYRVLTLRERKAKIRALGRQIGIDFQFARKARP